MLTSRFEREHKKNEDGTDLALAGVLTYTCERTEATANWRASCYEAARKGFIHPSLIDSRSAALSNSRQRRRTDAKVETAVCVDEGKC